MNVSEVVCVCAVVCIYGRERAHAAGRFGTRPHQPTDRHRTTPIWPSSQIRKLGCGSSAPRRPFFFPARAPTSVTRPSPLRSSRQKNRGSPPEPQENIADERRMEQSIGGPHPAHSPCLGRAPRASSDEINPECQANQSHGALSSACLII